MHCEYSTDPVCVTGQWDEQDVSTADERKVRNVAETTNLGGDGGQSRTPQLLFAGTLRLGPGYEKRELQNVVKPSTANESQFSYP